MKKWKVVADSSCDIRQFETLSSHIDYENIPFLITIDNHVVIDDAEVDIQGFNEKLANSKGPTSSACPAPDRYAEAYEGAENVICVTISSSLSGSYNSAVLGKEIALEKNPDANIHIFDSRSATSEVNLLVRKAISLAEENVSFDEMVETMTKYHQNTTINFLLKSVKNLVKNGRVNKIVGQMVGLLNIHLVGERTAEGTIELAHKSRGEKRGLQTLLEEIKTRGYQGGTIEITHNNNIETAKKVEASIKEDYPDATINITPMSALCCYYAESRGITLGYETK